MLNWVASSSHLPKFCMRNELLVKCFSLVITLENHFILFFHLYWKSFSLSRSHYHPSILHLSSPTTTPRMKWRKTRKREKKPTIHINHSHFKWISHFLIEFSHILNEKTGKFCVFWRIGCYLWWVWKRERHAARKDLIIIIVGVLIKSDFHSSKKKGKIK